MSTTYKLDEIMDCLVNNHKLKGYAKASECAPEDVVIGFEKAIDEAQSDRLGLNKRNPAGKGNVNYRLGFDLGTLAWNTESIREKLLEDGKANKLKAAGERLAQLVGKRMKLGLWPKITLRDPLDMGIRVDAVPASRGKRSDKKIAKTFKAKLDDSVINKVTVSPLSKLAAGHTYKGFYLDEPFSSNTDLPPNTWPYVTDKCVQLHTMETGQSAQEVATAYDITMNQLYEYNNVGLGFDPGYHYCVAIEGPPAMTPVPKTGTVFAFGLTSIVLMIIIMQVVAVLRSNSGLLWDRLVDWLMRTAEEAGDYLRGEAGPQAEADAAQQEASRQAEAPREEQVRSPQDQARIKFRVAEATEEDSEIEFVQEPEDYPEDWDQLL